MQKILIVEDDNDIAMLERDYLEIEGFQAQVISDGGAAEEAALTGAYDLILLDLMLPGRSGYEVCRRIRDSSTRSDCAGHSHPEGISTGNNRFSMQVRARVRE